MGLRSFPLARASNLNVGVAVLDSGIDPHEDFIRADGTSVIYTNYSTVIGNDASDSLGHGTSVAGVIAAQDNGIGVVGVAPGVRIWNIKCIGPATNNFSSYTFAGFDYCIAHSNEIAVANMSFGFTASNPNSARAAVAKMIYAGIVVVAAAGNSHIDMAGADGRYNTSDDVLPASGKEVMAVSAMDADTDLITPFSNFSQTAARTAVPWWVASTGNKIELAAPGNNVLTTYSGPEGTNLYAYISGTSFAAPHVAGLVALYIAQNGRAHSDEDVYYIRQAIVDESQRLQPQTQWKSYPNTGDPDQYHEALAYPSDAWRTLRPTVDSVVQNPGFELFSSDVTSYPNWTLSGGVPQNFVVGSGFFGQYFAGFFGASGAYLTQSIPTIPGHLYEFSFWAWWSLSNAEIVAIWDGTQIADLSGSALVSTQFPNRGRFSFQQTATSTNTTISLGLTAIDLDNVGVRDITQPTGPLQFTAPPAGQSVASGSIAMFGANIIGAIPQTCQWILNGTNLVDNARISGSATTNLTISNITASDAGYYQLMVSNVWGTITTVAQLTIGNTSPPVFQNLVRSGNAIVLNWSAVAGQTNQLQYKTNLNQPSWLNLGAPLTASSAILSVTNTLGPDPQRFYRVMVQ